MEVNIAQQDHPFLEPPGISEPENDLKFLRCIGKSPRYERVTIPPFFLSCLTVG